jgi:hypothetical protein
MALFPCSFVVPPIVAPAMTVARSLGNTTPMPRVVSSSDCCDWEAGW